MTNQNMQLLIGGNIRRIREASGKSIALCCQPLGMSRAFWNDVERGVKGARMATLERMAKVLGVSVRDFLEVHDEKPKKRRSA